MQFISIRMEKLSLFSIMLLIKAFLSVFGPNSPPYADNYTMPNGCKALPI